MKKISIILLTICAIICGCIEKIELELGKDPVLIIDGMISDEPGPYKVNIAFSSGFNENPLFIPINESISDADVRIVDDLGNEEILVESPTVSGTYFTQAGGIQGEIGRTYQLFVTLKTGEQFSSSRETIVPVTCVDDIKHEIGERDILNSSNSITSQEFIKFSIDFTDPSETTDFYRWRYEEQFKFVAPLADGLQAIRDALPPVPPDLIFPPPPLPPIIRDCWVTTFDSEFLLISDDQLFNGTNVTDFEIVSIIPDRKFLEEYSIQIKQFSLSERAFTFFSNIESQLENTGTIFETSNFQIQGNISSLEDSNITVLGYFSASAVSSKRFFIRGAEVSSDIPPTDCSPNAAGTTPIFCEDCTMFPGVSTDVKPEYWPF